MTFCAVIPTYNNARTVADIVRRTLAQCPDVIVVDDGSTDNTQEVLTPLANSIDIISYRSNRGKGYALRCGLEEACRRGFDYAVTLDSDGQHMPEDIPLLTSAVRGKVPAGQRRAPTLVIGSRNLQADGMPAKNSFANRFSNFWFTLQTGIALPDTQTGFRLYPLHHLPNLNIITSRYESELELLVFSAWRGVRLIPVDINVVYPEDRVTHFRPFADFLRISILNSVLCIAALLYGYPRMLITKLLTLN